MNSITLNGKEYPLNFGMAAKAEIYSAAGLKFNGEDFGKSLEITFETMLNIAHIAMKHGARVARKEFTNEYYDTCDLFDAEQHKLGEVVEMFNAAMIDKGNAKTPGKQKTKPATKQ